MGRETAHEKRKRLGLCSICGKVPHPLNNATCPACRIKRNALQKEVRLKRKAQGLCALCGQSPPEQNKTLCLPCLERHRKRTQAIKIKGQCFRCAKPNPNGKSLCDVCLKYKYKNNPENKRRVLEAYGGRCVCCGEDNPIFLSIDHINNDGHKHRKTIGRSGSSLYKWLIERNFPKDNFQLLCFNCNLGKRVNGGVCPHQQEAGGIKGCGGGQFRLIKD